MEIIRNATNNETFKITDATIMTLSAKENNNNVANNEKYIRELLDSSYQAVKRLFVLPCNNKEGDNKVSIDTFKKYFLPRVKIENYNIKLDGKKCYDQQINDSIKQYDKIRKIWTGQGDDYTTGCLLDFSYF